MNPMFQYQLLQNPLTLVQRIESRLDGNGIVDSWIDAEASNDIKGSAVLFLLTQVQTGHSKNPELCLLLNKRSRKVLQPGDLCCPGGGVQTTDKFLSLFMGLPFSPLYKWTRWSRLRVQHRQIANRIALLMTTGLREAWEEMRLNPMLVSLLGLLPVQQLVLFERKIYPLAVWVPDYRKLKANWEVDRILHVPIRQLLNRRNYGRYRLTFKAGTGDVHRKNDFACFIHRGRQGTDILWGATFRITMDFLNRVFGFQMRDTENLPVIRGNRGTTYLNGSLWARAGTVGQVHENDV